MDSRNAAFIGGRGQSLFRRQRFPDFHELRTVVLYPLLFRQTGAQGISCLLCRYHAVRVLLMVGQLAASRPVFLVGLAEVRLRQSGLLELSLIFSFFITYFF